MQVAIEVWTLFLKSRNQIDNTQLEEIRNNSWEVFKELGEKQNRVMFDDKPSTLFITALKEMLATKRIRLIDINKQSPKSMVNHMNGRRSAQRIKRNRAIRQRGFLLPFANFGA